MMTAILLCCLAHHPVITHKDMPMAVNTVQRRLNRKERRLRK